MTPGCLNSLLSPFIACLLQKLRANLILLCSGWQLALTETLMAAITPYISDINNLMTTDGKVDNNNNNTGMENKGRSGLTILRCWFNIKPINQLPLAELLADELDSCCRLWLTNSTFFYRSVSWNMHWQCYLTVFFSLTTNFKPQQGWPQGRGECWVC